MYSWPLWDRLELSSNILIAGAGGGFDVFSGIPLYLALREAGKTVTLANLSFAALPLDPDCRATDSCVRVTSDYPYDGGYFPELQLCRWLAQKQGIDAPVYAFEQRGVIPLKEAYEWIAEEHQIDTVILVDGGTDSLMRGDEVGLGTPAEDFASLAAASSLRVPNQFLVCLGFGVDYFHGVCHAQFLEAVSALSKRGGYLGLSALLPDMPESIAFLDAVRFANEQTPSRPSIVANSIASAIEGEFGDHHRTDRTARSKLWINPLMSIYWAFELTPVVERNLCLSAILKAGRC
ncbi:MAG: DUF1152 domain-containing protein [Verrucomicrobiales bacterium]